MKKVLKKFLQIPLNLLHRVNPAFVYKFLYFVKYKENLDLSNPKTYNEKLNWMKLNYRNNLMPICTDKYTVRQYVKECGLDEILNELIWDGYDPEEIPFENLPEQFVIKVTHGSGNNIICKDKKQLNYESTKKELKKWLKQKYIPCYGEWFYDVIKPRIIIETFLSEDGSKEPEDYKIFCFNNMHEDTKIAFTAVDTDRFSYHKRKIYDRYWNLMENFRVNFPYDSEKTFEKPKQFEKMKQYAEILSAPFPHARIDFYLVNKKIYFGEITFMSDAGFGQIEPKDMSEKMGRWIDISNDKCK